MTSATDEARGAVAAVCFDLDGTLLQSEEIRDTVRRGYVVDAGGTWSSRAQRDMSGMHLLEWAHYMHDRLGVRRPPLQIAGDIEGRIESIYRQRLPLIAGARETLERCARVWPLALATGSTRRLIELVLELGSLRPYFAATVSVDEVERGKPAPDVYLRAADLLCVAPARCVAVEDSTNGILSARAAGMRVVAVAGAAAADTFGFARHADVRVDSLEHLTPEIVRRAAGELP
jgi:HAD superfamily hydrolase (TIGR01509 family)